MQYTRKQIVEYLKTHATASVPDLSKALSLTLGNIRHHVQELVRQQILEQAGSQQQAGRGRPIIRYRLTTKALEHNLVPLAAVLLIQATHNLNTSQSIDFFQRTAKQMTAQADRGKNPVQQVQQAIQWLNHHNYQARWEASSTGPRITVANCPYLALLGDFPSMCQLDTAILSELNNRPMLLSNHRSEKPHQPHPCVFTPKTLGEN